MDEGSEEEAQKEEWTEIEEKEVKNGLAREWVKK